MRVESIESMIIAGPCSAESETQVMESAHMAQQRGLTHLRASLWKPRTEPGFDGVGKAGIPWFAEIALMGLVPATEALTAENAESVINAISGRLNRNVLVWIGSRNQNHKEQQEIGQVVKGDPNTILLIKNQPWEDERHWLGIVKHVVHGGADPNQILLCHRGFAPARNGFRNPPDFDMAMRVKETTGLPMLIDPSHIGGSIEKVLEIARQASHFEVNGVTFDGLMVEVHPDPTQALTDKAQQLSWREFDHLLDEVRGRQLQLVG